MKFFTDVDNESIVIPYDSESTIELLPPWKVEPSCVPFKKLETAALDSISFRTPDRVVAQDILDKSEDDYYSFISELEAIGFGGVFTPQKLSKEDTEVEFVLNLHRVCFGVFEIEMDLIRYDMTSGIVFNGSFFNDEEYNDFGVTNDIDSYLLGASKGVYLETLSAVHIYCKIFFNSHNVNMSPLQFSQVLTLSRMKSHKLVDGNVEQWVEYIVSGCKFDDIVYAFNYCTFNADGNGKPLPVEVIKEYKSLPISWVQKLNS